MSSIQVAKKYWYESTVKVEPTIELLTFKIGIIKLGIAIDLVDRVIDADKIDPMTNTQLLDLHERLFGTSSPDPAYYISVKNRAQIPVDAVPIPIFMPIDRIRQIPNNFDNTNLLNIATHVAKIDALDRDAIVFMLNI
jgi:hypothetical protein